MLWLKPRASFFLSWRLQPISKPLRFPTNMPHYMPCTSFSAFPHIIFHTLRHLHFFVVLVKTLCPFAEHRLHSFIKHLYPLVVKFLDQLACLLVCLPPDRDGRVSDPQFFIAATTSVRRTKRREETVERPKIIQHGKFLRYSPANLQPQALSLAKLKEVALGPSASGKKRKYTIKPKHLSFLAAFDPNFTRRLIAKTCAQTDSP